MGIMTILLTVYLYSQSVLLDPIEAYNKKPPGCTADEISHLIRLEIPDKKIEEICKEQ